MDPYALKALNAERRARRAAVMVTDLGDGKPRMLEFGVADETAWQVGLSCGGRIKVYVERLD